MLSLYGAAPTGCVLRINDYRHFIYLSIYYILFGDNGFMDLLSLYMIVDQWTVVDLNTSILLK